MAGDPTAARPPYERTSYLRLSRPRQGAGWRLALGIVAGAVGFLTVTLAALLLVAVVLRLFGQHLVVATAQISAPLLLATNLGLGLCIPLAAGLSWVIYRLSPRWLGSVAPGLRRRWLAVCVAVAAAVWGVLFVLVLVGITSSGEASLDGQAVAFIVVVVLTTPLQAAGEEYLFRGFLLQSLGATGLRAPVCWVISGVVFATAHGQFQPALFADRWLIGVVFAWLATSTGGLEASIALHAVKNVTVLVPAALLGGLSTAIDPSDVSLAPLVLDAVMLAIAAPWIRLRYRRSGEPAVVPMPPP